MKYINQIVSLLGKDNVYTSLEERICYSYDATGKSFLPDLVAFPKNVIQVSEILKLANLEKFPVIPRGAGSGFAGGSLPVKGGVVLVLTPLNKIIDIDTENLVSIVEPGVITGRFQREVEKLGLFYPPDPVSLEFSTLGGNVAQCAGGPRALKYGVTKDYVLGLEAVLPTGEVISTGVKTRKGVVGYDLTKLLVGSEGTLAVITKIILKLLPLPTAKKTMMAIFPGVLEATKTVTKIFQKGILPTTLEFIDDACFECVENYLETKMASEGEALLLIEVDGKEEEIKTLPSQIEEICLGCGASRVEVAKDLKDSERLWRFRRAISPSLAKVNPTKINQDITVPRSKIPDIILGIKELSRRFDLKILNFGHAGDGNIHTNIMIDGSNSEEVKRAEAAQKEIFKLTLELGGTISGEHGIGITKSPYLRMEIGEREIELMKGIKRLFDPKGILNPGKIFL